MNSKKLGQNFLQDISIIKQIVKALDIGKDDTIVEIGSGSGNLTRELVKENNLIYALEFDQNLGEKLRKNITDPNLRIHIGDARIIQPEEFLNSDDYKLVGNLPYYAANRIMRNFLYSKNPPIMAVIMLQKEVAQKLISLQKKNSFLSVNFGIHWTSTILRYVSREVFIPKPKVESAIVIMKRKENPLIEYEHLSLFFNLLKWGFNSPRKKIYNSISSGLNLSVQDIKNLLLDSGLDPDQRPETISVEAWVNLFYVWNNSKKI
tara:strand:- start:202 stop:990 length:789 start_codon:yes stop_codon:yes gene_type:complete